MFKIDDVVTYGINGVCKIIGYEEKTVLGKMKNYYILKSIENEKSVFYIPTDNVLLTSKIKKLLTEEEINQLIDNLIYEDANWISNENVRKDKYREVINTGDEKELFKMIRDLLHEKKRRQANKKRLNAFDEQFLKDAQQILNSELQYVLKLEKSELISYIEERIESKRMNERQI